MVLPVNRAREQALDAAEQLIYARGVRAVGMDDVRGMSGVSLKRLYSLFSSKEELVEAVLQRLDERTRESLAEYVTGVAGHDERLLAIFDWLAAGCSEPGYRGCAWINVFGEMGATSPRVQERVREHKQRFAGLVTELVRAAGQPPELAAQLQLLIEGAMVITGIQGSPAPTQHARTAAAALLAQARDQEPAGLSGSTTSPTGRRER